MIRLILSDIDGTLIPYGAASFDPELFELIFRLRELGIRFCPASGRQYHSMRQLFAPVADEIVYISENGCAVYGEGPEDTAPLLSHTEIPRGAAIGLARHIASVEGCDALVSGISTSYLVGGSQEAARLMREEYQNKVELISDPEEIAEPIIKEAAYIKGEFSGAEALLRPGWEERLNVARAGPKWLDFTPANKGDGLRGLCGALGLDPGEVMAFGDNWNDVPMLDLAGEPWIMEKADERLRKRYKNRCGDVISVIKNKFGL